MKVLWVCNMAPPQFQKVLGINQGQGGGWLENTLEILADQKEITLGVFAPLSTELGIVRAEYKNVQFWGLNREILDPSKYDKKMELKIREVLKEFYPDVMHIFGSEFPHSLSAAKVFNNPSKTVLHIQGSCFFWGGKYKSFLPDSIYNRFTFRDFIRQDNLKQQAKKFIKRGNYELQLMNIIGNVMGRTDWDKAMAYSINSKLKYYYCPENLRHNFLECNHWNVAQCERHSIFMAQGDYPIKGLHLAIEALAIVVKKYPDAKLYIAGNDSFSCKTLKQRLKMNSYSKYINYLTHHYKLTKNVEFVGILNADEMIKYYLNSNVYILPSVMENSPNSLMEAMQVGTPIVAADVGGVSSLCDNKQEGYLYPCEDYYVLAKYIQDIFEDDELAMQFSNKGISRMSKINSIEDNVKLLIGIYRRIENIVAQ